MNIKNRIILAIGSFFLVSNLFAQEFSSVEKISENSVKIEVIFKEIKNVQVAEQIISTLKTVEGVKDVEIFYPDRTNAYITAFSSVSAKLVIEALNTISIELDPKSLKSK